MKDEIKKINSETSCTKTALNLSASPDEFAKQASLILEASRHVHLAGFEDLVMHIRDLALNELFKRADLDEVTELINELNIFKCRIVYYTDYLSDDSDIEYEFFTFVDRDEFESSNTDDIQ